MTYNVLRIMFTLKSSLFNLNVIDELSLCVVVTFDRACAKLIPNDLIVELPILTLRILL